MEGDKLQDRLAAIEAKHLARENGLSDPKAQEVKSKTYENVSVPTADRLKAIDAKHKTRQAEQEFTQDVLDESQPVQFIADKIYTLAGQYETAKMMASSMLGLPAAIAGGAVAGAKEQWDAQEDKSFMGTIKNLAGQDEQAGDAAMQKAQDVFQQVMEKFTYAPKTIKGQDMAQVVGEAGLFVEDYTSGLAYDAVIAAGGSETNAKAAFIGAEAAMFWLPTTKFGKGATSLAVKGVTKPVAGTAKGVKTVYNIGSRLVSGSWNFVTDIIAPKTKAKASMNKASASFADDVAQGSASVASRVERAINLEKRYEGLNLSLGEATGDIAAVSMERAITKDVAASRVHSAHQASNVRALNKASEKIYGSADTKGAKILKEVRGDLTKATARLDVEMQKTQAEIATEIGKLQNNESSWLRGDWVRQKYQELYSDAKDYGSNLFQRPEISNFQVTINHPSSIANGIIRDTKRYRTPADAPSSLVAMADAGIKINDPMLSKMVGGGETAVRMSFDELRGHLKAMREQWAKAKAQGNKQDAAALQRVIKEIEGAGQLDSYGQWTQTKRGVLDEIENSTDANAVQAYREAKQWWHQNVVDKFEGRAGDIIARVDDSGNYKVAPEDVINQLVRPNSGRSSATFSTQFEKMFGKYAQNVDAWEQLQATLYERFAKKVYNEATGSIRPGQSKVFVREYSNIIDQFPGLREKLSNADESMAILKQAQKDQLNRQKVLETQMFAVHIKDGDLDAATKLAVESKDSKAAKMMRTAVSKSKSARKGMAQHVAKKIYDDTKTVLDFNGDLISTPDPVKLSAYLKKNKKNLEILMGPKMYKDMVNVTDTYKTVLGVKKVNQVAAEEIGSQGFIKQTFGTSFPSLLAQYRNVQYGRDNMVNFSARTLATAGVKMRYSSIAKIEIESLYNVDLMAFRKRIQNKKQMTVAETKKWSTILEKNGVEIVRYGAVAGHAAGTGPRETRRKRRMKDQGAL